MNIQETRPLPVPYEQYHHFKGGNYQILAIATNEEDEQLMVVYQALYGDHRIWTRTLTSFLGEVDHTKYPDAAQLYRFVRIGEEQNMAPIGPAAETSAAAEEAGAITDGNQLAGIDRNSQRMEGHPVKDSAGAPEANGMDDAEGMDPRVMQFLDARSSKERLEILTALHQDITDEMIDTMAIVLGVEVEPGVLENRYHDLRDCLLTISRYELEGNRLR